MNNYEYHCNACTTAAATVYKSSCCSKTQVHTQQRYLQLSFQMFQKAVLLLALVATLGPFLFAEGQEFGG